MIGPWQRVPDRIHRGWRYTIKTGHYPDADAPEPTDADIPAIAKRTVKALRNSRDYALQTYVGDLLRQITDEVETAQTIEEFDNALERLYDWGDEYRVIIDSRPEPMVLPPDGNPRA